ncbi:MAG: phosphoglycerate dehydrogenase [Sinimarinibacterium flocculans]|uniref:D-3-phosphoglycerate dehydrogenase n=1 Tax=Sinimarinibacterium flocculans TaxID=985250 RepID=A0A318EFG8_9GAMM|nr:phosphoglycerate dehydrogenase [Sinimarinibacterium flocculans]MEC9362057.1 phosphoglycerate dehydrogenase [Pseudomonadota bacterium]PXV71527.1 D-3-phosphoglycerate dehydrogenase [Sinimarinibacterium flocculans]
MYKIQTLNNISVVGLERLPRDTYEVASDIARPDAVLVRSADMHKLDIADSIKAIGRAGAGTNNIPVAQMSKRGVPVFNAPGANANAVKELVLASLFMAARNIPQSLDFVRKLDGDDKAMHEAVEAGKKKFVGFELPGRTLGVIGLGAIGVKVANAALELGMTVYGFDPAMTVQNAWQLNSGVRQAVSVDDLMAKSQFVSVHVPLLDATRKLINAERIGLMKKQGVVLNFARDAIVDEQAVIEALNGGKLHAYACDFPSNALKGHPRVIATPHLGASTAEAEDNCAVMVADQIREFLEAGNVRNSVNFPEAVLPLLPGKTRLCVVNENVPNMVGQISTALAKRQLNIADLLNKSRGDLAYTIVDVDTDIPGDAVAEIAGIGGVLATRVIAAR